MAEETIEGLDQLRRLAEAYKAGDKQLRKQISKGLREAATPLAPEVMREGAEKMPARGGLRERIAAGTGLVSPSLLGNSPSVSLRLKVKEKYDLKSLDAGVLRHPVYARAGRDRTWVKQTVPKDAFTDAFGRAAPEVRERLMAAVETALNDIARSA